MFKVRPFKNKFIAAGRPQIISPEKANTVDIKKKAVSLSMNTNSI